MAFVAVLMRAVVVIAVFVRAAFAKGILAKAVLVKALVTKGIATKGLVAERAVSFRLLLALLLATPLSLSASWRDSVPSWLRVKQPLTRAADLRYGEALYYYYQQQHFSALTALQVAKEKGGIQGHGDNPDIMLGGLYLAYGLDASARDLFKQFLTANRSAQVNDSAWLFLGRLALDQRDDVSLNDALSRISQKPEPHLVDDILALRVDALLAQGKLADALQMADLPQAGSEWAPYIWFNLAAALAREKRYEEAVGFYNRLQTIPQRSDVYLALYDRAMTAAGYAQLFSKNPSEAVAQFKQVRMSSPLASRALLGYGWAAFELNDFTLALAPWQRLGALPLLDGNVQEALVAIPYAYEKLGQKSTALQKYRDAEAAYQQEILALDAYSDELKQKSLLADFALEPEADMNWIQFSHQQGFSARFRYLTPLFAQNPFQRQVQQIRDLQHLLQRFTQWQQRVTFYQAMLKERERNRVLELERLEAKQVDERLATLRQAERTWASHFAQVDAKHDFFALLTPEESGRYSRIRQSEARILALESAGHDMSKQRDRLAYIKGDLLWRSSERYAERLWQAKTSLSDLQEAIAHSEATQERLERLIAASEDLKPYEQRLTVAQARVDEHILLLKQALEQQDAALRASIVIYLEQERRQLQFYLAQSRLAMARILEQATEDLYR